MIQQEHLSKANKIVAALFATGEVSRDINKSLYEDYKINTEIQHLVSMLLSDYNVEIVEWKDALFWTPGVDNKIFGYKNEEIKKLLGVSRNNEIYTCYFIMYTILITFYKQSSYTLFKDYTTNTEVVENMNVTLRAVSSQEELQNETKEDKDDSISYLKTYWESLDEMPLNCEDINDIRRSETKYYYVNRTLSFLAEEQLLICNALEKTYSPTDKFKALISNYFSRRDVKNALMKFGKEIE